MTALTDCELDTIVIFETSEPIICESVLEESLGIPSHEAHWYALCPCAGVTCEAKAMCERRREVCANDNGWRCEPGCGEMHKYDEIRWVRIE